MDTPTDGRHTPAVPSDTPSRALDVTVTGPAAAATDPVVPFHTAAHEGCPAAGDAPPLFLLHATFLC